jgi:HPt (histidine-containing phosphotransfer) domain-containing protein
MTRVTTPEETDRKRGKQEPNVLSHQPVGSMHEAHRLKGEVKNLGIKNLGHQKKKSKA